MQGLLDNPLWQQGVNSLNDAVRNGTIAIGTAGAVGWRFGGPLGAARGAAAAVGAQWIQAWHNVFN